MEYEVYLGSYEKVIGRKNAYIKTKGGFIQCEVVGYLYKTKKYQVITDDARPLNTDKIYFTAKK